MKTTNMKLTILGLTLVLDYMSVKNKHQEIDLIEILNKKEDKLVVAVDENGTEYHLSDFGHNGAWFSELAFEFKEDIMQEFENRLSSLISEI